MNETTTCTICGEENVKRSEVHVCSVKRNVLVFIAGETDGLMVYTSRQPNSFELKVPEATKERWQKLQDAYFKQQIEIRNAMIQG